MLFLLSILPQEVPFEAGAPQGTGLEWLTISAVVVPALLLIVFVYSGDWSRP